MEPRLNWMLQVFRTHIGLSMTSIPGGLVSLAVSALRSCHFDLGSVFSQPQWGPRPQESRWQDLNQEVDLTAAIPAGRATPIPELDGRLKSSVLRPRSQSWMDVGELDFREVW